MSGSDENDWIKIDMAETGKLQILKTNWNQAQTFSDAKRLCDSKGGKLLSGFVLTVEHGSPDGWVPNGLSTAINFNLRSNSSSKNA